MFTWLFGDRGIPASYRHMDGFGSHTYQWVNAAGRAVWVKYHFKTDQGIDCLTRPRQPSWPGSTPTATNWTWSRPSSGASSRAGPSRCRSCLWRMPRPTINPFDLTKVWPHADYPLLEVGRLTLDRNADNYFGDVEQAAFDPGNFVPGIGPSPDKMLQGRLFAYGDAHRYRLGINHTQLRSTPRTPRGEQLRA